MVTLMAPAPTEEIETRIPSAAPVAIRLLEYCAVESQADIAYLYRAGERAGSAELVARTGASAPRSSAARVGGAFPLERLIVAESAWNDPRLVSFPEIVLDRIESVAIVPVDATPGPAALAVSRRQSLPFGPRHIALFDTIALALAVVLQNMQQAEELGHLRAELERTREKLAGRKAIDRAKAIIQARDACTEHEAYGHLRRLSRTMRGPMSEIARRVIQRSDAVAMERKQLLA